MKRNVQAHELSLPVPVKAADRVEITVLMDNYIDALLGNTDVVTRPVLRKGEEISRDTVVAEHGLSMLVTVYQGGESHRVLFDTGHTETGVPHNLKQLEIDLSDIEAIVLSHAHMDHTGALYPILKDLAGSMTLVVHPGAFHSPRFLKWPDGRVDRFPNTLVKEIGPKVLVPMHCTGWKAIRQFSDAFPAAFVLNSVGSKFELS